MEHLKIVTLNCWGIPIPGISKMRAQRMEAIGRELAKGEYHIAVLEEIWSKDDYKQLCDHICKALPHSHYFYSGAIGSGVCVFSKLPILETFFHRFHLNGQAYKIQHGDWFGGKGVGMCKLEYQGFKINLYATHIHAEYDRANDEYLPHRVSQAFEMSQFIRLTASECDVIIAAGDFNMESSDVGYKLLLTNTPLHDAWEKKVNSVESNKVGATCECPWNMFRDKSLATICPDGKRIDYILFGGQPGTNVSVERCNIALGKVPDQDFPFSDHEGVAAELKISKAAAGRASSSHNRQEDNGVYLQAACDIIHKGVAHTQGSMGRFQLQAVGLAVVLYWLCYTNIAGSNPQPIPLIMAFVKLVLVVVIAALVWLSVVVKRGEMQGLLATKLDLVRLIEEKKKMQ
ncbi:putative neutral sphingomyelinase [Littorina saxatilis]|uniref:sphingomyelin phosphodiesterase n=1 Tax=Littorina saxatilis TaxID=31220 RepID=A0AAN9BNY0_9CAEN